MLIKEKEASSIWLIDRETGETTKIGKGSVIRKIIHQPVFEKYCGKLVYRFNKWNNPITSTLNDMYFDLSKVSTNNWRRMRGMNPLPYRKMFKYDTRYALVIYNKQRKYIRDKYTFEEWKAKKGIK